MEKQFKLVNRNACSAREIMKAAPIVNKERETKLIRNMFRMNINITDNNCPKTFDELTLAHEDSVLNRAVGVAMNSLKKMASIDEISDFMKNQVFANVESFARMNSMPESDFKVRLNSYGEFFINQLTTYMPTLFINPTRGISYMALPIISYGAGDKYFKIPGYGWSSKWQPTVGSPTVNTDVVRVLPKEMQVEIKNFRNAVTLEFNEQLAMARAMAQDVGNNTKFDAYAGTFAAIAVKFIALAKSYQLYLDEMAWNGRPYGSDDDGKNGLPLGYSATCLATTSDINTYTFADAVPGVTAFNGSGVDAIARRKILSYAVSAVSTNSGGLFVPNVLFVDLKSFNELIADTAPGLDTNVLQYLINNNIVDAIIPVPAWNEDPAYDNKVTIIGAYLDPQVLFFNNSLPMVQTGVAMTGDAVEMKYRTRTSGTTIVNKLGLIRVQGNRT